MFRQFHLILLLLCCGSYPLAAQVCYPRMPEPPCRGVDIHSRNIQMDVRHQTASVTVTDEIYNACSAELEIEYLFPLPPDALVDQFTLVVNGQELGGEIMDAEAARRHYQEIVRRDRDPGLLEYAGYGLYRSRAFPIAPRSSAQLTVQYCAVLPRDGDRVEIWHPLSAGRLGTEAASYVKLTCTIEEDAKISTVYSPTVDIDTERLSARKVRVTHRQHRNKPQGDFQLFYAISAEDVGATLLSYWPRSEEDGYYFLLVSPSPEERAYTPIAKDLIVVLDRSGSMGGEKIQQARDAALCVVDQLNPGDRFNVLTYNDKFDECFSTLRDATLENRSEAKAHIARITAQGGTNIHASLEAALGHLERNSKRPSYVIFLTDGLPTVGVRDEAAILNNSAAVNLAKARIFAFGVGYDVNVRLLDRLAEDSQGKSTYVRPTESIESKVAALYNRIRNPFMTEVEVDIDGFATRDNCPAELGDLFEGDQLVRVGRIYRDRWHFLPASFGFMAAPALTVRGLIAGRSVSYEYPVHIEPGSRSSRHKFIEKLWAVKRIGELLDEIQLHGKAKELMDELISLSKKYGVVTPYTSYLASENTNLSDTHNLRRQSLHIAGGRENEVTGPQAFSDADARSRIADAPSTGAMKQLLSGAQGFMLAPPPSAGMQAEGGTLAEANSIQSVGEDVLYRRGNVWVHSSAIDYDVERDRSKFTVVRRFGDEYSILIDENSADENKVLAAQQEGQSLLIVLRGRPYLIE